MVQQPMHGMSYSFKSSKNHMSPKPRPVVPQGYEKGFDLYVGKVSNGGMHKSQQDAGSVALVDDHIRRNLLGCHLFLTLNRETNCE